MKISYNWLNHFVKIDDIDPKEIELKLTMSTSEIESVEEVGGNLDNVVVGKIIEVKPHPRSDHLMLTRVDVGSDILEIISGAANTKKGAFVPVALIGAKLPQGIVVRHAKIRGVDSFGIVCSEKELGISDDHTGLWLLNDENLPENSLRPGVKISSLFPTKDYIIEIDNKSITNRPDLWGHYGFARELSAIYGRELKPVYSQAEINAVLTTKGEESIDIEIKDKNLCPRYTAIMLSNIKVKKSPYFLRRRLYTLGVRPINNIVDVTNHIMLEIGQPLHAFDASKIMKHKIIIRRAHDEEIFMTLDGIERVLSKENLLITDEEKAVAIAGVMGGLNSEIDESTEKIIIESANFNAVNIRRTAVKLGLRTEASNRFEKSIDPELTVLGIAGSVALIKRILPSVGVASKMVDKNYAGNKRIEIPLNTDWISRMIGVPMEKGRIIKILNSLQFDVKEVGNNNITVGVPSFRATKDILIPQDLVEEVGRIYGYDNISPILPQIESSPPVKDELLYFIRKVKTLFSKEMFLTEVYTYSFQDDSVLEIFYPEDACFVKLSNPISTNMKRLRKSLIPGLFSIVNRNLSYKDEFGIFEVGSIYLPLLGMDKSKGNVLPDEKKIVSALILKRITDKPVFYDAKGRLEILFDRLYLDDANFIPFDFSSNYRKMIDLENLGDLSAYHPSRRALLINRDICFGIISELNPKLLKKVGVDFNEYRISVFEIDLALLNEACMGNINSKKYKKLPKYPEVVLALAVVVDENITVSEVRNFIKGYRSKLIEDVKLFDIYRGKPLTESKKNLAFNVHYRSQDRTLTEKEANSIHEDIARKIREHGWELR